MSQFKNASVILIAASVFLFVSSVANLGLFFYYELQYGYLYEPIDYFVPGMSIVASLLLIAGFVMLRGSDVGGSTRLCPKCGRTISLGAQFCPYCGWSPKG